MELKKLIDNTECIDIINFKNVDILGISYNSKITKEGDIFVCLVGENTDGHEYVNNAIEKGAVAIMCERQLKVSVPQLVVKSTRHQIADIADTFYESPSKELNLIGVTGTNGKTTVTHLLQLIFEDNREECSVIGTLGYKLTSESEYKDAKHTTPQAPELQALLFKIKNDKKIKNVAMEVSSHALEQKRVEHCDYKGAVLTNLTQDHLDYHVTMDNYFNAKAELFKGLKEGSFAVINSDDEYADRFLEIIPKGVKTLTYGVKKISDVIAKNIEFSTDGAKFVCSVKDEEFDVQLHMNGMFSVYNFLAAITTAKALGFDIKKAAKALENIKGVAGRFEVVAKNPLVIVDYAHTPDGLQNVLKAAREITLKNGKLICLFGCGGDRDATKRPKMGAIAEKLADKIVITSDNPRSENPEQIISDIIAGLQSTNPANVIVESNRGKAIALLKDICNKEDVVIIAGKGHENYQILKDKTIHFDDREEARKNFCGVC